MGGMSGKLRYLNRVLYLSQQNQMGVFSSRAVTLTTPGIVPPEKFEPEKFEFKATHSIIIVDTLNSQRWTTVTAARPLRRFDILAMLPPPPPPPPARRRPVAIIAALRSRQCLWFQFYRASNFYCMAIAAEPLLPSGPPSVADWAAVSIAAASETSVTNATVVASAAAS
jgi:hypothetical protein